MYDSYLCTSTYLLPSTEIVAQGQSNVTRGVRAKRKYSNPNPAQQPLLYRIPTSRPLAIMGHIVKLKFGNGNILEVDVGSFTWGWLSGTRLASSLVDTAGGDGDLASGIAEICLPDWLQEDEMQMVEGIVMWKIRFRAGMLPDVSCVHIMCSAR